MSITVTAQLTQPRGQVFGSDFTRRIRDFEKQCKDAAQQGAAIAQRGTRSRVTHLRPPVPQRPGRKTTQGNMQRYLDWNVTAKYEVTFDLQKANKQVPYWFIQEIGTGETGTMKWGGSPNSRGRQHQGSQTRTIPSQIGRRISPALAFGTGARGTYTHFGDARGQGLYLKRHLKGVPVFRNKSGQPAMVTISKEIEGKHFVRDGAKEGFRQYRRSMLAAAKSTLVKQKTFP